MGCFMLDILLPMPEDCVQMTSWDLITKNLIRTDHKGKHRTHIAIYKVLPHVMREHLASLLSHYSQILGATYDSLIGGWSFEIMVTSSNSASPVTSMTASGIGVVKPLVGSRSVPTFPKKPLSSACAVVEKESGEWLVASRPRGKCQKVGSQSPEAPGSKGINSPIPSTSVKGDIPASFKEMQKKYETHFEKTEKIKRLQEKLEVQLKSH